MSLEHTFTMVRVETCDNCKYTVTEKSTVECIDHARDLLDLESKRSLRETWGSSSACQLCEGVKHE